MKKKGETTANQVLSVIIAVLALSLLFYGAYRLYEVNVNQEQENAKAILGVIEAKIDLLEDGEENSFAIRGLSGWFLKGFDELGAPERCFPDSCLCICKGEKGESSLCQDQGVCRRMDFDQVNLIGSDKFDRKFTYEVPGSTITEYEEVIKPVNYIVLPKNLFELKIEKVIEGDLKILNLGLGP